MTTNSTRTMTEPWAIQARRRYSLWLLFECNVRSDEAFVDLTDLTDFECWVWQADATADGTPLFTAEADEVWSADHFAYEALVGEIPEHHTLVHTCDTGRMCVNPRHMRLVNRGA